MKTPAFAEFPFRVASPASYQADDHGMTACGTWGDLSFQLRLTLAESATACPWHVELETPAALQ